MVQEGSTEPKPSPMSGSDALNFDGFPLCYEALLWDVRKYPICTLATLAAPSTSTVVLAAYTGPGPSPNFMGMLRTAVSTW